MKFREYNQEQGLALPPYLEDLIEPTHLVRVINKVIDKVDVSVLSKGFKSSYHNKGGNLPYHPGMMLKVLTYAYSTGTYTSRKISKQLRENIHYMWLSGMQYPDFRTINRYRSTHLKDILPHVLSQLLQTLHSKGLVDFETIFVDGTKIESDSNKHKVVWGKNVKRYKSMINERVDKFLTKIDNLDTEEMKRYGDLDLAERGENSNVSSTYLQEVSDKINQSLTVDGKSSKSDTGKELRKISRKLKSDSKKMQKYEEQESTLNGRNSYSKEDPDASVMKMKNEELRPGYNVQSATNNDFIVGTDVYQNANDGTVFIPFMNTMSESEVPMPKRVIADAGYGHEEVYSYLDSNDIKAYIKYPSYRAERSNESRYRYHYSKFTYDVDSDTFICPTGKKLFFEEMYERKTDSGYVSERRVYRCRSCASCPNKSECSSGKTGRSLTVSFRLRDYQQNARSKLSSDVGRSLYRMRSYAIETVFGDWKRNGNFRRFNLRGLEKVRVEIQLLSLAYNLRKLANYMANFLSKYRYFLQLIAKKCIIYGAIL